MIPPSPTGPRAPAVVIVEGPDDRRFCEALIKCDRLTGIEVVSANGVTNLRDRLRAVVNEPRDTNLQAIALIRDGDGRDDAAFQSAADALSRTCGARPQSAGVLYGRPLQVGVLVIPGNLDELVVRAARSSDPARADCIDAFLSCIAAIPEAPKLAAKAWVHACLSTHGKGDVRVGEGAERGYWDLRSEAFQPIRSFLAALRAAAPDRPSVGG